MRAALLCFTLVTGCSVPDVCDRFPNRACLALEVRADQAGTVVDQLRIRAPSLALPVELTPTPARDTPVALPVRVAVVPAVDFVGPFSLDVDGLITGTTIGTGHAEGTLLAREHQSVPVTLHVLGGTGADGGTADGGGGGDGGAPDLALLDGAGGKDAPTSHDVDAARLLPSSGGLFGGDLEALSICNANPARVYAGTTNGLWRSDDSGNTWRDVTANLSDRGIGSVAVAPSNCDVVYVAPSPNTSGPLARSDDGGGSFTELGTPMQGTVDVLAVSYQNPQVMYLGVQRSEDGGKTFLTVTGITGMFPRSTRVSPSDDHVAFVTTSDGVFRTSNGTSWSAINTGLPTMSATLAFDGSGLVYAFSDKQILSMAPSGTAWNMVTTAASFISYGTVALSTPGVAYFVTDAFSTLTERVWRFSGSTITEISTGLSPLPVRVLAIDPSTANKVYAGTNGGGVLRTDDSGATWTPRVTGMNGLAVNALTVDPRATQTVWAGTALGVYRSTNGGADWKPQTAGIPQANPVVAVALDPTSNNVFAATKSGAFLSTNGGGSFNALTLPGSLQVLTLALDPVNPANVFVGTFANGLFRSTNGGTSFAPPTSLAAVQVRRVVVEPAAPGNVWVVGNPNTNIGAVFGVFKSTDGGDHFSSVSGVFCGDLAPDPHTADTLWGPCQSNSGFEKVMFTTNGGASWTRSDTGLSGFGSSLLFAPSRPSVMYFLGFGLAVSLDGGRNWSDIPVPPISDVRLASMAVDPSNEAVLYVGLTGSPALFKRAP
jgi:photosystem II stability/assembly factor-like uncharacterized protein